MLKRESEKLNLNREDTLIHLLCWANNKAHDESWYKEVYSEVRSYFPDEYRKKLPPLPLLRKVDVEELRYYLYNEQPFIIDRGQKWKLLSYLMAGVGLLIGFIAGLLLTL